MGIAAEEYMGLGWLKASITFPSFLVPMLNNNINIVLWEEVEKGLEW